MIPPAAKCLISRIEVDQIWRIREVVTGSSEVIVVRIYADDLDTLADVRIAPTPNTIQHEDLNRRHGVRAKLIRPCSQWDQGGQEDGSFVSFCLYP